MPPPSAWFDLPTLAAMGAVLALSALVAIQARRQRRAVERLDRARADADVRQRVQDERHLQALRASEERFHNAFSHAAIGMALVDCDGLVVQANRALAALLGHDLAGQPFTQLVAPEDGVRVGEQLARLIARDTASLELELRCRHADGHEVWVALHAAFLADGDGTSPCLILQLQDIDHRRETEARLQHIAYHDALTGLPNRARFATLLDAAIARVNAGAERGFALMYLDFDRFKLINDSMGHNAGDAFLVEVARRIRHTVRPQDMVARLGGDEFAVLIESSVPTRTARQLADRLLAALREPLAIDGVKLSASASIGITESRVGYERAEEAMRDADIAMYRAKGAGKARYAFFDIALRDEWRNRLQLEADLRQSLAAGALEVYYQPLFNLGEGLLTGFEALARWDHPTHGSVPPSVFIPIAEESGLIGDLTEFVMREACHQLGTWLRRDATFAGLKMHVNVAGADLARPDFVPRITRAVLQARLRPEDLVIELTENILMERVDGALGVLQELAQLGVGLSVDDFGTGYSSLSYLSRLPIDSLKIDASFVRGLGPGSKQAEVVRAIVSMGAALGKEVIAEGIESSDQLEALRLLGCEHGQGFHMALPLPAQGVDALLELMRPGVPYEVVTGYSTLAMPLAGSSLRH